MKQLLRKLKYGRQGLYSALMRVGAPIRTTPHAPITIGIRYSVFLPLRTGWRIANTDQATYRATLFDDCRLDERYRLFSNVMLPSLLAQSLPMERGVREAVVYVSEGMPAPHFRQLTSLAGKFDWMKVQAISESATGYPSPEHSGLYASVRLDDDDALATWFLERLSGYVQDAYVGKVITFPSGVQAGLSGDLHLSRTWSPKIALGLAYIAGPEAAFRSIYELGNHTKVQERASVILDNRPHAYMRTIHRAQDTAGRSNPKSPSLPRSILHEFGLKQTDIESLSSRMSAPAPTE